MLMAVIPNLGRKQRGGTLSIDCHINRARKSGGWSPDSEDAWLKLTWWRHQMETFTALLALCEGNPPVAGEFPSQRPVTRSFDVFFDLRLNKRLNKQSRRRWFETQSCSLWRHWNVTQIWLSLWENFVNSKRTTDRPPAIHYEVMIWNRFPFYWAFVMETTGHR